MGELARRFEDRWERVRLLVPYADGGRLAELYALGAPVEEREDTPDGVLVIARLPRRELQRFASFLVAESSVAARERVTIRLEVKKSARGRRRSRARVCRRRGNGSHGVRARRARTRRPGTRSHGAGGRDPGGLCGLCATALGARSKARDLDRQHTRLVDSGYRGELLVNLVNHDEEQAFVIERGMRIAQLVILQVPPVELVEVDELPASERGADGFGSSG